MTRHDESTALIAAPTGLVFAHVDDHTRLSSHMSRSSWCMGGGRMETVLDQGRGHGVGSHIRLSGRVFGIALSVDEVVTERTPPSRKVWETVGSPRLFVIGPYRMGFEVTPRGNGSLLQVFIEYALPERLPWRWLGRLFGRYYAQWCTRRMVDDTVASFGPRGGR
ncbi:MAG: SRPBCC family protein [Gemmatimonadetes bacterium]|nr:SRPBCC family protein [Gemmatimonadota bacterium]